MHPNPYAPKQTSQSSNNRLVSGHRSQKFPSFHACVGMCPHNCYLKEEPAPTQDEYSHEQLQWGRPAASCPEASNHPHTYFPVLRACSHLPRSSLTGNNAFMELKHYSKKGHTRWPFLDGLGQHQTIKKIRGTMKGSESLLITLKVVGLSEEPSEHIHVLSGWVLKNILRDNITDYQWGQDSFYKKSECGISGFPR